MVARKACTCFKNMLVLKRLKTTEPLLIYMMSFFRKISQEMDWILYRNLHPNFFPCKTQQLYLVNHCHDFDKRLGNNMAVRCTVRRSPLILTINSKNFLPLSLIDQVTKKRLPRKIIRLQNIAVLMRSQCESIPVLCNLQRRTHNGGSSVLLLDFLGSWTY